MDVILLETNSQEHVSPSKKIKVRPAQLHSVSGQFQCWISESFWITPEDFARMGLTLVGTLDSVDEMEVPVDDPD